MKRLAIITTHPIQYNAPLFALMAKRKNIELKVFYTWGPNVLENKYDPGFEKKIEWDIPLLEGYQYEFIENRAIHPGSHHFMGINNPGLIGRIEDWGANILLVYGWAFISHLKAMRYFHGKIPILFRGDSTLLVEQNGLRKFFRLFFLKWVYSKVDFALFTGKQNKAYFLKHRLKEEQLILALHAIDNDRFAGTDNEYEGAAKKWKQSLGIGETEITLLYAGKFIDNKNPGFIINLGKRLEGLPVKFVFVGNGPLENQIKEAAGDNPQFIFINFQNQLNMPAVYRMGDIFILSSKFETWGLAANEAMASGLVPMLSANVGGAADLVADGENGIIFDLTDFDKCVSFIKELIKDKALLDSMKQASLKRINEFSLTGVAKAIEDTCSLLG